MRDYEENMRHGALADRIVAFGRVLRRAGMHVGTGQIVDALRAVDATGIRQREDVYQALFSVFVSRHSQKELFDQVFHLFWRAPENFSEALEMLLSRARVPKQQSRVKRRVQEAMQEPPSTSPERQRREENPTVEVDLVGRYSPSEVLKKKDFAEFTAEEIEQATAFMRRLRWPIEPQRTRRLASRERGRRLDVRRTVRHGLRNDGELVRLFDRGPKSRPRPIVVLCDISGSMEAYSRMLLHFMHAVTGGMQRVESFVFGTRLTRITRQLQRRDVDEAVQAVAGAVNDWAGGTRIGEALKAFNYSWLRRVLRSSGVVLIISDGCDRGDVDLLQREIARLARNCYRLMWLNPLMGYDHYQPLTRGMQAALPYLDYFLPVHNLESLESLSRILTEVAVRPPRA